MTQISDLANLVLDQLEEERTDPIFWNLQNEIYPFLVEAMNMATLATGEPQIRQSVPFAIQPGSFFQAMPPNALALLRMDGPGYIRKYSWWELDKLDPGWESYDTSVPSTKIQGWFPFGFNKFGIFPPVVGSGPVTVYLTVVQFPVYESRPYTGAESVDYQQEYMDALVDYASHAARIKEGGQELLSSLAVLDRLLY